jgi:pyruvate dehydrogenase E1 component alpha subunit
MGYIPKGEVAARLEDDPVPRFRAWLLAEGHASEDELAVIDKQALVDVEAAWTFANDSPYPDVEELYTDVVASA